MIDSHCHLNFIKDKLTVAELVEEATAAGVHTIINPGTSLATSIESLELARRFESVYALVGVHPHDASEVDDAVVARLKELASEKKVVGIGEIGLDFYRDLSPRPVQRRVFERLMGLAVELKMPVVIHTREAFEDTLEIVQDFAGDLRGGVFHCFPGDIDQAWTVFDLGFSISVGGMITFNKSKMADLAREAPLDKMFLETDAPYLAPVPHRGKTNRPAYVTHVCSHLAQLKGITPAEVEKITDRNCQKLFGLVDMFGE
ncbi:MAG: TatD family hydrolase [candidate division Zixibacteria bacterium]|nr:TatD family hydrolase [candidate division Zixibacteria bacterium]